MRLATLDRGHSRRIRIFFKMLGLITREEPPDVVKTLYYRPQYFGIRFCSLLQRLMRGPSEWSVGTRELYAAFTSRLNQCPF
jgi:hypothetical protein